MNLFSQSADGLRMAGTVLVVDEADQIRESCCHILEKAGYQVRTAGTIEEAASLFDSEDIDIVLADLSAAPGGALAALRHMKRDCAGVDVILMSADASAAAVVDSLRSGASDYITKPFELGSVATRVARLSAERQLAGETRVVRERLRADSGFAGLVGVSPPMQQVYRFILQVARRRQPVLLTGESGTGKELVARAVHQYGNPKAPFVPIDCGALSASLIEAELFGHVAGAFTGANQRRQGLFASAGEGTLFLDEIGELPLALQVKLLRAIQEREFRPLGSNHCQPFHARLIAATNRDLQAAVRADHFRSDLYFRLNVLSLELPPLRERREDIPLLAQHCIESERKPGDSVIGISREAMSLLTAFSWPGNVRELQNHIQRAMALSDGPLIQVHDLAPELRNAESGRELTYLEQVERNAIVKMLDAAGGHRLQATRMLGISKTTLYKKLKDYGLEGLGPDACQA